MLHAYLLNQSLSSNAFLTSAEALFLKLAVNASASIESIFAGTRHSGVSSQWVSSVRVPVSEDVGSSER